MRVVIHQPQFVPYLGFFNKVSRVDKYIVLDDVKDIRSSFTNRNKVKSPQGYCWLIVPLQKKSITIRDERISWVYDWRSNHLETLRRFYTNSEYFDKYIGGLTDIYFQDEWKYLVDFDMALLFWLFSLLGFDFDVCYSSEFNVKSMGTRRLVDICQIVGADIYVSGEGGRRYMVLSEFEKDGIGVEFQEFNCPTYPQRFKGFIPNLSILDALFNCGAKKLKELIS